MHWALFGAETQRRGRRARRLARVFLPALAALVAFLNLRGESPVGQVAATAPSAETIRRGAYLALAGNCAGCHTAPDGTGYAGGRGIETPFGVIFASNLTPDPDTGIGDWSADEFWRAMHNGRSKDGRLLYPAFPYPNYTQVTREDSDAIFAFLQSRPPVARSHLSTVATGRVAAPQKALRMPEMSMLSFSAASTIFS